MTFAHSPLSTWTHTGSSTPYDNENDGDCPSAFWASWELRAKEILKHVQEELEPMKEWAKDLGYDVKVEDVDAYLRDALGDAPTVPLE